MILSRFFITVIVVVVALVGCNSSDRTLYVGGAILTMNASNAVVEALAVEDGRIVAAGNEADLRKWADASARVVDLRGKALLPGFIDAHSHFPGVGITAVYADLNSPPVGPVTTINDVVDQLASKAEETKAGHWVIGFGYDDTLIAEHRHPTRADLDRVSTDHPVAAMHVSGHLAAVNSRGLSELGIDSDTPNPVGGVIVRDPISAEPNGVLEEIAADGIKKILFSPGIVDSIRILRAGAKAYIGAGVTTAQNGLATKRQIKSLALASRLGLLPLRLVLWPDEQTAGEMLDGRFEFSSYDPEWLRIGAVKLVDDGSIQAYTGYLGQPYYRVPGDDPYYRGYPLMSAEELAERVARYQGAGLQVAVHGNGDAAIDDILDAFEYARAKFPRDDLRSVIIHAQMAREDQLERMARLHVIPSFFVLHTFYWGDRHVGIFMGPERAARMSPLRSAAEHGVRYTLHCDSPVVPMEPLRLVWSAVNRRSRSGSVIGESERVSVMQALRAVTIDAAYQHFEEDLKGSLEAGKLADLVILSASPLRDPEHIDEIRVLETIIGGDTVFRADD